ncbi:TetR family transcriptional regulator [soil metagenome]
MRPGRKGRRPGSPDTQGQILEAASHEFAGRGYDGATIRGVAAAAGVDPALVMHYFGSKERLFVATLHVPVNPADVLRDTLATAEAGHVGERLIARLLEVWDETAHRSPLISMLRSVAGEGPVADTVRQFLERSIIATLVDHLPQPEAQLRAVLVGSQIVGLLLARYVVRFEPLASADPRRLAAIYGPTIERYAYGDLPPAGR